MAELKELWNRFEFQAQVLRSDKPVVVVFHQLISPESRKLLANMEHLAEDYYDQVKFVRINTDLSDLLNADWSVSRVPTVLLFRDGRLVMRWVNEQNSQVYRNEIENQLRKMFV